MFDMWVVRNLVQFFGAKPGIAKSVGTVALLAVTTLAAATAQDFRLGLSAFRTSNYSAALSHWLPSARGGDANAQAALGHMYLHGIGVAPDRTLAAIWYRHAAAQNQIDALHALGRMYLHGQGVARDPVRAYVLCEIALAQGEPRGLPCRDDAEHAMTGAEREEARRRVAAWNKLAGRAWLADVPRHTVRRPAAVPAGSGPKGAR